MSSSRSDHIHRKGASAEYFYRWKLLNTDSSRYRVLGSDGTRNRCKSAITFAELLTSAHLDRLPSFQDVKMCKNLSQKPHILRELLQHHNPFGEEIEVKIGYARVSTADQNLDSQLE